MITTFARRTAAPAPLSLTATPVQAVATAPRAEAAAGDRLAVSDSGLVKVADREALSLVAKRGDTYWSIARRFAATTSADGVPTASEINAYVKDLIAANGNSSKIRVGQTLALPTTANATWKLPALVAAQKSLGREASQYDWSQADAKWGYAEAMEVTVPTLGSGKAESLAIHAIAEDRYQVQSLEAYYRENDLI